MNKKFLNGLKENQNTLSGNAREFADEVVKAFEALEADTNEHDVTALKDEIDKIAAKFAEQDQAVTEKIAKVRESIMSEIRRNVTTDKEKFTPEVCKAIANAFVTSRDRDQVEEKLNAIATDHGIKLTTKKNDVSGLTYQQMVDYAIQIKQDDADEIYDSLYKTRFGKIFYSELDDTDPEQIAKQWDKTASATTVKDVQKLVASGKELSTAEIYKMQRVANADLDDAAEVGQEAALVAQVTAESRKAVKALIVRAILVGDTVNTEGKKITKFETVGTKKVSDLFTTVLNPKQANQVSIVELARLAEAVKTERKWLFVSPELLLALREYVPAAGATVDLRSTEDVAAKIGVDRIFKKDYLTGVSGLHAIIIDPDQYWVREKKVTDVAFPQWEKNARGFLYEINAGGMIRGLKSTAVLREA